MRPGSAEPVRRQRRRAGSISDGSLPSGVHPSEAPTHFLYSQLKSLQSAAKLRSEKFGVLNARDVEGLSRELGALDARCQYLRETHKSLRTGRRTLHTRMLTYLRSTRSAVFSRENLLKQEEALAELDSAIDDWRCKLEKVCRMALVVAVYILTVIEGREEESEGQREAAGACSGRVNGVELCVLADRAGSFDATGDTGERRAWAGRQ